MLKSFVRWTEVVFWLAASCRLISPLLLLVLISAHPRVLPRALNLHIHFLFTFCAVAWAFQTARGTKAGLIRKRGRFTDRYSCWKLTACKKKCCKPRVGVILRCWEIWEYVVSCGASIKERNLFDLWTINAWFAFAQRDILLCIILNLF